MRLSKMMSGQTWVAPVDPHARARMEAHEPPSLASWAGPWMHSMFLQDAVPKLAVGSMAAALMEGMRVIWVPLMWTLVAWVADFAVGVARAVSDPKVKIDSQKAWRGVIKGIAIPWLLVFPMIAERFTYAMVDWDPAGKYVTAVAAMIVWDLASSAQRNGRHFFHHLVFRRGWFAPEPPEGGGGPEDVRKMVEEAEAEAARKQLEIGERLAGMAERERNKDTNGRTAI